jgi:copper chaperone CopZ
MCKTRIEKAAASVDGVSKAEWNDETKLLAVSYDPAKTDVKKVSAAVAKAGHDTEAVKAEEKDYKALPACCQYDRKK